MANLSMGARVVQGFVAMVPANNLRKARKAFGRRYEDD